MPNARRLLIALGGILAVALLVVSLAYAKGSPRPVDAQAFGQFLGPCNSDSDCSQGNACQSFKQLGLRCTHTCQADSECAPPSKGCSKQHRCSNATATAGHPRQ